MEIRSLVLALALGVTIPMPLASQETVEIPKTIELVEGTEVALRMAQDISSRTAKLGDPVELALAEDLKVGDTTVAKAGARALGEVVQVKRPDFWGEPGIVSIRVHFLRVGDKKVEIRGATGTAGRRYVIIRGSQGIIKAGTQVKAFVAADVEVAAVAGAHAASAQTGQQKENAEKSSNPAFGWGSKDATPGVTLELREVDRRKQHGVTEVSFQVLVEGAPKGKTYILWIHSLAMQVKELPPAPLGPPSGPLEYRIDTSGNWQPELPTLTLHHYRRGEWADLRLVSTDGEVKAIGTMVPFPIESTQGGCKVSLKLVDRTGAAFFVSGEGFEPGEVVTTVSRSDGEVMQSKKQVAPDGSLPPTFLLPEVAGRKKDHKASYTVSAQSCKVTVNYEWGRPALKIQ